MPPRGRPTPATAASAAAAVASSAPAPAAVVEGNQSSQSDPPSAGPAQRGVPMPSGIAWPIMKRYQALFILVAHAEVRSRGDAGKLSVKEQETVILQSFKSHVRLWYRDDQALLDSSQHFPPCPVALKRVGVFIIIVIIIIFFRHRPLRHRFRG